MIKEVRGIRESYLLDKRKYDEERVVADLSTLVAKQYEVPERQAKSHIEQYFDNYPLLVKSLNKRKVKGDIVKILKEAVNYTLYMNGLEPAFKVNGRDFRYVYTGYISKPSLGHVIREINRSVWDA